jgi:hypothetical protein
MTTPTERANQLRGNLSERAGGIRGRLDAKAQRLAEGLARNLSEIIDRPPTPPTLRREEPRGGIPSARGYAQYNYQPGSSTGTGGGIASPLIEGAQADADPESPSTPVLARESYPVQQLLSSDGLFVWEVTPPSKVTFRDANGEAAEFRLANPYAEEEA